MTNSLCVCFCVRGKGVYTATYCFPRENRSAQKNHNFCLDLHPPAADFSSPVPRYTYSALVSRGPASVHNGPAKIECFCGKQKKTKPYAT